MAALLEDRAAEFRSLLLAWFAAHARDLPWRRSKDPYRIWVSEIMLQQTRVKAVLEHYACFLNRFPDIRSLAAANEAEVLTMWSGLGYYRRARLMHRAAQVLAAGYGAVLPSTASELRLLPGIGEYTSAAIASIAFGEPVAVVDGNVERVILRLDGAAEDAPGAARSVRAAAGKALDPARPGDFNQAMMELGATVCLPRSPLCPQCPVQALCATRGEHMGSPRKKMISRHIAYALVRRGQRSEECVLLVQRPSTVSLMPGMWELPEIAMELAVPERTVLAVRHAITVTNYHVHIARMTARELCLQPAKRRFEWVEPGALLAMPLTGLTRKVLRRLRIMPSTSRGEAGVEELAGTEPASARADLRFRLSPDI